MFHCTEHGTSGAYRNYCPTCEGPTDEELTESERGCDYNDDGRNQATGDPAIDYPEEG